VKLGGKKAQKKINSSGCPVESRLVGIPQGKGEWPYFFYISLPGFHTECLV